MTNHNHQLGLITALFVTMKLNILFLRYLSKKINPFLQLTVTTLTSCFKLKAYYLLTHRLSARLID